MIRSAVSCMTLLIPQSARNFCLRTKAERFSRRPRIFLAAIPCMTFSCIICSSITSRQRSFTIMLVLPFRRNFLRAIFSKSSKYFSTDSAPDSLNEAARRTAQISPMSASPATRFHLTVRHKHCCPIFPISDRIPDSIQKPLFFTAAF